MSNKPIQSPERRRVLSGLGAGAALAGRRALRDHPSPRVRGGQDGSRQLRRHLPTSVETALVKPFQQEFGVEVTVIDTPDLAKVKAQQMTGNIEWDVFDAVGAPGAQGSKAGYWEPLDPAMFDGRTSSAA